MPRTATFSPGARTSTSSPFELIPLNSASVPVAPTANTAGYAVRVFYLLVTFPLFPAAATIKVFPHLLPLLQPGVKFQSLL